jgi:excisionase family DNA binding protein
MMEIQTKRLLTRQEVEEILGLGKNQIYTLMTQGRLPSVKVGGSRRFLMESIDAFRASLLEEAS